MLNAVDDLANQLQKINGHYPHSPQLIHADAGWANLFDLGVAELEGDPIPRAFASAFALVDFDLPRFCGLGLALGFALDEADAAVDLAAGFLRERLRAIAEGAGAYSSSSSSSSSWVSSLAWWSSARAVTRGDFSRLVGVG